MGKKNDKKRIVVTWRRGRKCAQVKMHMVSVILYLLKRVVRDFPGGPVVKNPPSSSGDVGLIPGRGTKIPHATGQLSLSTTTTELM